MGMLKEESPGPRAWGRLWEMAAPLFSAPDLDALLSEVAVSAARALDVEGAAVLLLTGGSGAPSFRTAARSQGRIFRRHLFPADKGLSGSALEKNEPLWVNDVSADLRFDERVDEVAGCRTRSLLAVPLADGLIPLGIFQMVNKRDGRPFTREDVETLGPLARVAGCLLARERRAEEHRDFFAWTLEILAAAVEASRPELRGRPARVARTACAIGRRMGVAGAAYQDLRHGALLRGLGSIVGARGDLEEALSGAALLRDARLLRGAECVIRHRLERWDGRGLPDGLSGTDIPLGARILALAEELEGAESSDAAEEIARAGSGSLFDPAVVEAYLGLREPLS